MAAVYKVKYVETINGEEGDTDSKTVAAKNGEAAIAKVKKDVEGTWWEDTIEDEKKPGKMKKVKYTIESISIEGVEKVTDIDIA